MEQKELEAQYQSVDPAYELALASYDTALKRYEAIDTRIQSLIAFAATMILAIPVARKAMELNIGARYGWLLWLSGILFILSIGIGILARLMGSIQTIDPGVLFEKWLGFSPWEFKKNLIYFAGEAFTANHQIIERKHKFLVAMMITFALGVAAAAAWLSVPSV